MAKPRKRANGEGTVYYDEHKKKWVAQTWYNGKRISKQADLAKDARKKLDAEILKRETGGYIEKSKLTVHDIIKSLANEDLMLNQIRPITFNRRIETLNIIDRYGLGQFKIQDVTDISIKEFYSQITFYSDSQLRKVHDALKKCFVYCIDKKLLTDNPYRYIKRPKSEIKTKKISALTVEEQKKLISVLNHEEINCKYRYQMLIEMALGMRMGEINALTLPKINFTFGTITVNSTVTENADGKPTIGSNTKTDAGERILQMPENVKCLLQEYIEKYYIDNPEKLLFYDHKNKSYISTKQVNSKFKRIIEKYNVIPVSYEYALLEEKHREKVAFKKYTFYQKTDNGFKAIAKEPKDWKTGFKKYYFKKKISDKHFNQHMLRHTFATRCIENDIDIKALSEILGHSDIKITLETYCDIIGRYKDSQYSKINSIFEKLSDENTAPDTFVGEA